MTHAAITGWGRSGSWEIRADALGAAIGATVAWRAMEFNGADVVIYIKRMNDSLLAAIRKSGLPWVWDVIDAWPRPMEARWDRQTALIWIRGELRRLKPTGLVVNTTTMLNDSGWIGPSIVLPHHSCTRYQPRPLSEKIATVGYEGLPEYLGPWRAVLEEECSRRGWKFIVGDLSEADVGVALRHDFNYANRFWKSNVKLANLQNLGIPVICSPEEGYREFGSGRELIVEKRAQLTEAFDRIAAMKMEERLEIREAMIAARPTLEKTAKAYSEWLEQNF